MLNVIRCLALYTYYHIQSVIGKKLWIGLILLFYFLIVFRYKPWWHNIYWLCHGLARNYHPASGGSILFCCIWPFKTLIKAVFCVGSEILPNLNILFLKVYDPLVRLAYKPYCLYIILMACATAKYWLPVQFALFYCVDSSCQNGESSVQLVSLL